MQGRSGVIEGLDVGLDVLLNAHLIGTGSAEHAGSDVFFAGQAEGVDNVRVDGSDGCER